MIGNAENMPIARSRIVALTIDILDIFGFFTFLFSIFS
jgi:hypothetical protein